MNVREIQRATWLRLCVRYQELSGLRAVESITPEQLSELREIALEMEYRERNAR